MNLWDDEAAMWREALEQRSGGKTSHAHVDAEQIWRAVHGELPADDLGALVDRMAVDPDLQLAWRLAHELREPPAAPAAPRPANTRRYLLPLALLAAAGLLVVFWPRPVDDTLRGDRDAITQLEDRQPLPRDAFTLRWAHPDGSVATVELRTADLRTLARSPDLTRGEWTVPADVLASIPAGDALVWQVRLQQGTSTTTSDAFVVVLAD